MAFASIRPAPSPQKPEMVDSSQDTVVHRLTLDTVIEQLPFSRLYFLIIIAGGLAHGFDAFDTFTIAYAMPAIIKAWHLTPVVNGMLASAGMWGTLLGGLLWGPISDRFGRKVGFAGTILGFSLLTGLTAFAITVPQFLSFRFITGLCLGGLPPCASTYIAEQMSSKHRGRAIASTLIWWPLGAFAAAVAGFTLVPRYGWKPLFLLGGLPIFLSFVVIIVLPESPRWLAMKRETAKLEKVLKQLGASSKQIEYLQPGETVMRFELKSLLRPPYRIRFIATAGSYLVGYFAYFGWTLWLPSILVSVFHFELGRSFLYTLIAALFGVLGKTTAYYVVEKLGRKAVFYCGYGPAAVLALIFGFLHNPTLILACACLLGYSLDLGASGHFVWTPELYPSYMRGTANSWSSAAGKIGAALAPLCFGMFISAHRIQFLYLSMAVACSLVCAIVAVIGIETRDKVLSEIEAA